MSFYEDMYRRAIKATEKIKNKMMLDIRKRMLVESIKKHLYLEMNRSLFVKHKLLFSFLLTLTSLKVNN